MQNSLIGTKKVRESGIELLRIILIIQVIFLHVGNFGKYGALSSDLGGMYECVYYAQRLICRCPVYVFMIISGYFSVTSKATMKNVFSKGGKIYSQMIFYSLAITAFAVLSGVVDVDFKDIVKSFFPLTSRTWYFISVYLLVLILSPVVNKALNSVSKKDFQILLLVLFFLFSIWQTLAVFKPFSEIISVGSVIDTTKGRGLDGFLYMYIVGAYIRLHWKKEEKTEWKYLFAFLALAVLDGLLIYITKETGFLENYSKIVNNNNAPIEVIQGVFLFLFFRTVKFKSLAVNFLASQTLGIYMIHEHWLMREIIWDNLFSFTQTEDFYSSKSFILIIWGIVVLIFAVCTVIDLLRMKLFEGVSVVFKKLKN